MRTRKGLSEQAGLIGIPLPAACSPDPADATAGHRERLRQRLLAPGADELSDRELLEIVLCIALPRRDAGPVAAALIDGFGSFANAIAAPAGDLQKLGEMPESVPAALKAVHAAALRLIRAAVLNRPLAAPDDRLLDYLHALLARERVEKFRVLFLDRRRHLLHDEEQGDGIENHTPVYPRKVMQRALDISAAGLILVHNHPSGDPTPSREDIEMTREISQAACSVGLQLHDHVIVGNGRCLSFRREGLL